MKTRIKACMAISFFLLIFSCKKEAVKVLSAQTSQSENLTAGLKVGQSYGGGIIFYLDTTKLHGLIAAPHDIGVLGTTIWYNDVFIKTGAKGKAIGTGASNTTKIIQAQGNTGSYAAKISRDYTGGGYTDWFLPSINELKLLYKKRNTVGGFVHDYYWSSTEQDINNAWFQYFDIDYVDFYLKSSPNYHIRPVRAF